MNSLHRQLKHWKRTATALTVVILIVLLTSPWVLAQEPATTPRPQHPAPSRVISTVDPDHARNGTNGGSTTTLPYSIGVEWINHFDAIDWPDGNRDAWDDSCDGLYNRLVGDGWQSAFHWADTDAWETDWKDESLGGEEDAWSDSADIAMLCTHGGGAWDGNWGNILLTSARMGSTHTDADVSPGDAYMAYGDNNLEWLAFDSCSVLADTAPFDGAAPYNDSYWAATFNRLHLMLGFNNEMYVNYPGDGLMWGFWMSGYEWPWGGWLIPPASVTQSWFWAVDGVQPGVTCARVLAEDLNNYNDYLWGKGYVSPDPVVDPYYYKWDHCSTAPKALQVENLDQISVTTMPVLQVVPRSVDQAYVAQIAHAFDMTGTIGMDRQFYYMTDPTGTHSLVVDLASGGFNYHDLAQLAVPPTVAPTLPNADQAFMLAETFFATQGEGLPGVWERSFPIFSLDQISGIQRPIFGQGAVEARTLAITPTDAVLTFGRTVAITVGTPSGPQLMQVSVVGPGSKLMAYFGDQGQVIGMQGGTRDVQATKAQVPIMTADEAWAAYLADPTIALAEVSLPTQVLTRTGETLGYYEQSHFSGQSELVPVWIFTADYAPGMSVEIYVPAATDYLPPLVIIFSPPFGSTYNPGDPIPLAGAVLMYGTPPFSFKWTASGDGLLGYGSTLTATLNTVIKSNGIYSQTISLDVTDANGQHGTAARAVFINAAIYLPITFK
jgi:hypothetical protein